MRISTLIVGITITAGAGGLAVPVFAAEDHQTVRLVGPTAVVLGQPSSKSEEISVANREAAFEVIDRDGEWYWVVLPADTNGTRRTGWVRVHDVEVVTAGKS